VPPKEKHWFDASAFLLSWLAQRLSGEREPLNRVRARDGSADLVLGLVPEATQFSERPLKMFEFPQG